MDRTWQALVAEFVATFALIFVGAGSVVMAPAVGLVGIALAHGIVLAVMVSITAHISGGHVNPAVTIGLWVTGKIESLKAVLYVAAQLLGGILGALVLRLSVPEGMWRVADLGTPTVDRSLGVNTWQAILLEAILTFFLVFVVYGTAVDRRGPFAKTAGFTIGLVLTFDILVGGPLTGASVNPARTLGPGLVSATWTDWWIYWVGPIIGGLLAGAVYFKAFLGKDEDAGVE